MSARRYSGVGLVPKTTPQSHPIPGYEKVMSKNGAGGYTFDITCFKRLERFLILGSDSGTMYASAQKLSTENYESLNKCLEQDYKQAIDLIADVSFNGRASSNDPALFALAVCASSKDCNVVRYAMSKLPLVARIGTHLFTFVQYLKERRSFGRAIRKGIADWYLAKKPTDVSYQMAKYQSRNGMSHADVFRLSHLNAGQSQINPLVRWSLEKKDGVDGLFGMVECLELMRRATTKSEVIRLIGLYNAPREVVPTEYLKDPDVWKAMLPSMGLEAIVRNLGNMSSYGVFNDKQTVDFVTGKLNDPMAVRKARLHPLKSLVAMMQYKMGHGAKGNNSWTVNRHIEYAIENAFYNGFAAVEPTGQKTYYGLDISGSMGWGVIGGIDNFTPRMAVAALCMVLASTETNYYIRGFSHNLIDVPIKPGMKLDEAIRVMSDLPFGGTNCALPIEDAIQRNLDVDMFVTMTDNESWYGQSHAFQVLEQYRKRVGHRVKFVTVGMTATNSSINNPNDFDALDCVGFDADLPRIINEF
jgi:60 kDa SS-A/Ro ribonucleoprotein